MSKGYPNSLSLALTAVFNCDFKYSDCRAHSSSLIVSSCTYVVTGIVWLNVGNRKHAIEL